MKFNQTFNYKRFDFSTNNWENRQGKVTFVKIHKNGLVENFFTDTNDETRNCLVVRNGKQISIGVRVV